MSLMETDHDRAVIKRESYRRVLSKIYVRVILTLVGVFVCPAFIYFFFKNDAVGQIGAFGWVVLAGIVAFMVAMLSLGLQGTKGFVFAHMFKDAGDDVPEGNDWDPREKAKKESAQIKAEKAARKHKK